MNLRELVAEYVVWCRRFDEVVDWTGPGAKNVRQQLDRAEQRVKQAIELAESAMELCEAVYWAEQIDAQSEEVSKAYGRWLELRESRQTTNTNGKEWWNAK